MRNQSGEGFRRGVFNREFGGWVAAEYKAENSLWDFA